MNAARVQMERGIAVSCSGQGIFFFFLIEIRLEYGFERQLADKKDIGKGLWLGVNQSLR